MLEEDLDKGILSVEAILEFKHPNGTDGSVSSMKSIVLEEYEVE